jgi:signal transduction histidine kinase
MRGGEAIGLSSMRERVQLLGGTLRLSSLLGQGTTVKILIPLGRVLR